MSNQPSDKTVFYLLMAPGLISGWLTIGFLPIVVTILPFLPPGSPDLLAHPWLIVALWFYFGPLTLFTMIKSAFEE